MPLYEYQCAQCGEAVDKRHGFDEAMTDRCEHCGGELKRTFNVAGIVFKGSGFYINDSRKSSGSSSSSDSSKTSDSSTKAESSGSTESSGSAETKSEPKGDKKSDAAA